VIISNNCWGGQVYQWFQKSYQTPFVGLFLYGPCYMKFLQDIDHYMAKELVFAGASKYEKRPKTYPVGILGGIEIHFTHYKNEEEALKKWNRRKARMLDIPKEKWQYMICDREFVTEEMIINFHDLPLGSKISFGNFGLDNPNHIKIVETPKGNPSFVPNGKQLFKLSFLYFDIVHWLNFGIVKRTRFKD